MILKALAALAVIFATGLVDGCASNKDGLSGPYINTDEPQYDSSIARSKDRPQMEKEARVDFFKYKQGF